MIGDLHLGHRNIIKYRPQFKTATEHDETIVDNIKHTVNKRDNLYILGDAAFTHEALKLISNIHCRKILIMGNHDQMGTMKIADLVNVYDAIHSLISYRNYWLSHAPIHSDELRSRLGNIHGHTHTHNINDSRYLNLSADQINFTPVTFSHIQQIFEDRNQK